MPPSTAEAFRATPPQAPRVLIATAAMDGHARRLKAAFEATGARVDAFDLSRVGFDTAAPAGLRIPGYAAGALPDAVCVRTMDAGTFEQITRRLGVLHAFARLGVPVTNDATAIEACVDKAMTSFRLTRAGLLTPHTVAVESRPSALDAFKREAAPMVLKPLFGAQGKGLRLIERADDLPDADAVSGVYYLQRFVGVRHAQGYRDMRVLVSRGRAVAAMWREAPDWITNIKQGGRPVAMMCEPQVEAMAEAAARAVKADFCGIDILRDANDRLQVIEVNSMPAWSGLARATGIDIAAIRARDVLELARVRPVATVAEAGA